MSLARRERYDLLDTRVVLSHLALEITRSLPFGLVPHSQIELATDSDSSARPLLIESFVRREWGGAARGFGLQVGTMNPPLSLEHSGPAWTRLQSDALGAGYLAMERDALDRSRDFAGLGEGLPPMDLLVYTPAEWRRLRMAMAEWIALRN